MKKEEIRSIFYGIIESGQKKCCKVGKWNEGYMRSWTAKVWCPGNTCCAKSTRLWDDPAILFEPGDYCALTMVLRDPRWGRQSSPYFHLSRYSLTVTPSAFLNTLLK